MEWLIAILTIIFTPMLTLAGIVVTERTKLKSKRLELDTSKDENLRRCQEAHKYDIDGVRKEFNGRLDDILEKIDEISKEQYRLSILFSGLKEEVQKHNGVMEKTIILERDVAVLKNRESVSEHRIDDLEKRKA